MKKLVEALKDRQLSSLLFEAKVLVGSTIQSWLLRFSQDKLVVTGNEADMLAADILNEAATRHHHNTNHPLALTLTRE